MNVSRQLPIIKKYHFDNKYALYKQYDDVFEVATLDRENQSIKHTLNIPEGLDKEKAKKWLCLQFSNHSLYPCHNDGDLLKQHKNDILQFQMVKATAGIDLQKFNYSVRNTAFFLFHQFKDIRFKFESMSKKEERWIYLSNRAGLRYCKKGKYKHYRKIDINSAYASFLQNRYYSLPYAKPIERPISHLTLQANEKFNYGLYHVEITIPEGVPYSPLFNINKNNIYTHWDLYVAKKVGYKLTLKSETYLYYKKRFQNNKMFGKFIHRLYKYKHMSPVIKAIMNVLWGAMCQKKVNHIVVKKGSEYDLNDQMKNFVFDPKTGTCSFDDVDKDNYFLYDACRIGPFVTSYCRYYLYNMLKGHEDDICYIHTDGFIIKDDGNLHKHFRFGHGLGQVKYERIFKDHPKTTKFKIKNSLKMKRYR